MDLRPDLLGQGERYNEKMWTVGHVAVAAELNFCCVHYPTPSVKCRCGDRELRTHQEKPIYLGKALAATFGLLHNAMD